MALQIEKVLSNRFEFSLNGGSVISTIYPRLTTDGNTCNFKTVTGANLIKKQNISVSDITIIDTFGGSGTFNYTTVSEMWFKLTELNFWGSDTGAGVASFQALSDTDGFFGNDGKVLIVNQAENKIDYTTFYNINEFKQLSDVEIASLIDGKILGVTLVSGVPKITLVNKPTDGTTYFSAVGGFDYDDLITSTTPLVYTSGNLALSNDTLGDNTFLTQPPYGVTSTWNEATNSFDFSELSEGDEVFLRVNIDHTTSTANQITKLFLQFDDGSVIFNVGIDENIQDKSSGVHNITRTIHFYVRDAWKNNPVYLYYSSDAGSTIDINGWHPYIIRKSINVLDINDDNFKTFRVSQVASPTVDVSTIAGTVKIGYEGTFNKITNILFDNEFSDYLSAYASIISTNTLYLKVYNKTKKISLVAKITAFNYTDGTNNYYNVSLENTIDYTDVNVLNVLEFDVSVSDLGGGSFTSPLTTKGDILSYTTEDVRIPVGLDGQVLVADSTKAAGVKWDNNTGAALTDKLTVLATLGQTGTTLSPIPNSIDLYKDGQWLIEDTDFTYNNTTGVITWDASEAGNYYEIRPYNSVVSNDGVVLESDTTTAAMSFVIDEDDMVSDSPTKVPTQQSVKAYVDANAVGALQYQPEITISTSLTTQKGLRNIYPVNSGVSVVITVNKSDYIENDIVTFQRKGDGTVEFVSGTDVRIYGERDENNRHFIRNKNTWVSLVCLGLNGSILEFECIGAKKTGYTGAVITSTYTSLREGDVGKTVTVTGYGFSANMDTPIVSANATLNSWAYISSNIITLNLDAVGVATTTVTVTYRNPDETIDVDAITIANALSLGNIIRYFDFDGDVIDATGTANGTPTGITYTAGQSGSAAVFAGGSNYVTLADSADLSFGNGTTDNPVTMSFWAYVNAFDGEVNTEYIINKRILGTNREYQIYFSSDFLRVIFWDDSTGGFIGVTMDDISVIETWYNYAITYDGSGTAAGITIYKDGVAVAITDISSGTYVAMENLTADVVIGTQNGQIGSSSFNGRLDSLYIENSEASASEVLNRYIDQSAGNELL